MCSRDNIRKMHGTSKENPDMDSDVIVVSKTGNSKKLNFRSFDNFIGLLKSRASA